MPGFELIGEEEKAAVIDIFENQGGVLFAHGFDALRKGRYQVREFEQACASKFGAKHALAVTSGTAALVVALKALGVKPGDEVITQAFTFVAAVESILAIGAVPVIVNIDESLNMDPLALEEKINIKTKVIMPVHMLGMPADMSAIKNIANKYNLKIVEDNCEAIGATLGNDYLGTIGDIGVMSFDHGKALTTGEGGMLLSHSKGLDEIAREYHDHGHQNNPTLPRGRDTKRLVGFNYRMTEIQAAIGKVQLRKLDRLLVENAKRYDAVDALLSSKFQQRKKIKGSVGQKDCYIFRVPLREEREKIIELLFEKGFGTKNLPDAVEWHCAYYWDHIFNQTEILKLQKSKNLLEEYIAIPISLGKSTEQYRDLATSIVKCSK
mgnify:FL=1